MNMFAIKYKHSVPTTRTLRPSRFGYRGLKVKAQQAEIRRILRSTGAQAKLTIGQPNDNYEQEADRVADVVMRMPEPGMQRQVEPEEEETLQSKPLTNQITPLVQVQRQEEPEEEETLNAKPLAEEITPMVQRQVEPEEEEEELQAKATSSHLSETNPNLESHIRSLKGGGQPLSENDRAFFESRFGRDFVLVRIHTDTRAAESAQAVNARAFTVGKDVVFGAGLFAPGTHGGRRLLAHELAHVVQQRGGEVMVRREPKKEKAPKVKTDVSIVLSDEEQDFDEGRAYARTVIRVTDVDDAAAKLKALGAPIGTLYIVSHSNREGNVQFISRIGTISWVPISDLGNALKGAATIDTVDFRGCKMGEAVGAMESFRKTVGAQSTKGTNCWSFTKQAQPLEFQGAKVTSPSQIPKKMQGTFNRALLKQIALMVTENKKPVKNCLVGLAAGEKAGRKTLPKIWQLYWANHGNLVASWASPDYNKKWQKGSICTKDMTTNTRPCGFVVTKAPAASAK